MFPHDVGSDCSPFIAFKFLNTFLYYNDWKFKNTGVYHKTVFLNVEF